MLGKVRINKFIAAASQFSRREADRLIDEGRVTLNGKVLLNKATEIKPGYDVITLDGEEIIQKEFTYLVVNKPKNYITTTSDEKERQTVMELIPKDLRGIVNPVGRLDRNTTGILLFTNDGDLAQFLLKPKNKIKKIYQVTLDKKLDVKDMHKLVEGFMVDDRKAKFDQVAYLKESDKKIVAVEITSGQYRIVRRLFFMLGYSVKYLDRVYFAGLDKNNLEKGKYKYLKENEIQKLKNLVKNNK